MKIVAVILALLLVTAPSGMTTTQSIATSLSVDDAVAQDDSRSPGLDELYRKVIAAYELKDAIAAALLYADNAHLLSPERELTQVSLA